MNLQNAQRKNYSRMKEHEAFKTDVLMEKISLKQRRALDKNLLQHRESSLKAKRYNELVEEVQARKTARLVDNMDPRHLESLDRFVTKQQRSVKQMSYLKEHTESLVTQKRDEEEVKRNRVRQAQKAQRLMMREMARKTENKSLSIDKKIEQMRNMRSHDILRNRQFKMLRQNDRNEVL